ncbi:MAG TPA: glycosyltransferase family 4 protein [Pilimelia sp.]|nr:glycosyltransferase family 4 protein [Pilimelia sp.]
MRIAVAAQEYPPAGGGISTQSAAKAAGLAALGHEVHVVTHSRDGARSEEVRDGVHLIRIPGAAPGTPVETEAGRWLAYSAALAAELTALRDGAGLDVVDLPDYGAEGYVHLANRTPWRGVPTVVQLHGPLAMLARTVGWPEPGSPLHEVGIAMERACVRLADRVYASSACAARWSRRCYGAPAAAVPTLHMGVDPDAFRPAARPGHGVVSVGRLAASKGVFDLLDAVLAIRPRFPDLRLTLVGAAEPGALDRLTARAAAAGAPDVLDVRGPLPQAALPAVLAGAAVFALPSHYEAGPGLAYLEAMACGLPVVATAAGGAVEVVHDGATGTVVPPRAPAALAGALAALLGDPGSARAMGRRGRDFVTRYADRRRCLRRLERLLWEVVEAHGR